MPRTLKSVSKPAALLVAGVLTGGVLAGSLTAYAADSTPSPSASTSASAPDRVAEKALTGDTKSKVEAAVLAAYPGATIERTETDSDGVYESHVTTADGEQLVVQVGDDFAVTGTQQGGHGHGRGPGGGAGEQALTGDTKSKVEAAVLVEYPGATIERSETDNGGVYEAHITTADDEQLTVLVDEDFAVTGTQQAGGR